MGGHIDQRRIKELSERPEPARPLDPTWLNPQISVYWLWVGLTFGIIAALPWYSYQGLTGSLQLPVAAAYTGYYTIDDWQSMLLVHTAIAVLLAVPVAVLHVVYRRRRARTEPTSFTLRQFLLGTGLFALIFAGLGSLRASPVVFAFVLLVFSGWPLTLILSGVILRQGQRRQHARE